MLQMNTGYAGVPIRPEHIMTRTQRHLARNCIGQSNTIIYTAGRLLCNVNGVFRLFISLPPWWLCRVVKSFIINLCAVSWRLRILQTSGSVTQTGLPGSYFIVSPVSNASIFFNAEHSQTLVHFHLCLTPSFPPSTPLPPLPPLHQCLYICSFCSAAPSLSANL